MTAIPQGLGTNARVPTADGINVLGADGTRPIFVQLANNKLRATERIVAPAPGAQIHAGIAGGGALNVSTAFTQMMTPTNVRLSRSGAGVATVYTVTGTRFGVAQTETIASNGASDVEGVKIFDVITSLTSDVDPTVTTTVKTGVMLGLSNVADAAGIELAGTAATAGANAVAEVFTLNAARDGFTPTTAPDGTKMQFVRYRVLGATVQP